MRIGTRKSNMEIAQTNEVIRLVVDAWPEISVEMHDQDTVGDTDQKSRLAVSDTKRVKAFDAENMWLKRRLAETMSDDAMLNETNLSAC